MKENYDVIVIGAGNAGLTAGAATAAKGLKTLLIEKNTLPGGCATSFRRGRFEFDASLHELANIGTQEHPGSIRTILESFGVDINWSLDQELFRVIAGGEDGYDVTMPTGEDNFIKEMERVCPGSSDSVKAAFDLGRKADAAVKYLSTHRPDPAVMARDHADFMRITGHCVDDCLNALDMPKKAQNIFKTYWPYLGADTRDIDLAHYMMMLDRYVSYNPALPQNRSHEISLAIADSIIKHGGEIWYNTEVTRLLVKDGKAYGVVAGGKEIYGDYIIANCFPDTLYAHMLSEDEVPARAKKLANSRKPAQLFFTVFMGLDRSCSNIGINNYTTFIYDTPDAHEQYLSCADIEKSLLISTCPNVFMPDASPEGTCILTLTTMLTEEAWGDVAPQDYKRIKNRIAKRLIETFEEKLGVSVQPHIEEISIAAPPTFARYLGTPNGTPYGYAICEHDRIIPRMMCAGKEQFIESLYFVGAHSERAAGYTSAYANGNTVGRKVVKEARLNGRKA